MIQSPSRIPRVNKGKEEEDDDDGSQGSSCSYFELRGNSMLDQCATPTPEAASQPRAKSVPETKNEVERDLEKGRVFQENDVTYTNNKGCRAPIWQHFKKAIIKGQPYAYAKCNYCGKFYACDSKKHGTGGILVHFSKCDSNPVVIEKKERERRVQSEMQTRINFPLSSMDDNVSVREDCEVADDHPIPTLGASMWKYDKDQLRKAIAYMIIVDGLPFSFVENEGFNYFMKVACPQFDMPSRRTIIGDCYKLFLEERENLKNFFLRTSQRVSLTTDTWTSLQKIKYMVLTAHYIDQKWRLNKRVLSFIPINSHKGKDIGLAIESCLKDWGIDKVFTICVDNASSNDGAVAYLKSCLTKWDQVICDNKYLHVKCVCRILNLVVQDGLKEVSIEVQRVRNSIMWVLQSPSRLRKFWECLKMEGIEKRSSLVLDVPTRWNSTYLMLHVAQQYERAFGRLGDQEPLFKQEMTMGQGWPCLKDWETVRLHAEFLEVFYETTLKLSGGLYVTSNNFFYEWVEIEGYINDMEECDNDSMRMMATKMRSKKDKYWGDVEKTNKLLYLAIVFDPRYKLIFVDFAFKHIYKDVEKCEKLSQGVKDSLYELYAHYQQSYTEKLKSAPTSSLSTVSSQSGFPCQTYAPPYAPSKRRRMLDILMDEARSSQRQSLKSELDRYLDERNIDSSTDFNVLHWWKQNRHRFPVLGEMARDILAFPVSTVSSELAFSTGDRILDRFKSSLTPTMLQAFICAGDWLRKNKQPIDDEENVEVLEAIENEMTKISLGE